jgi:hypothetical protein
MGSVKKLMTGAGNNATTGYHSVVSADVLVSFGGTFGGVAITLEMLEQGNWEPVTEGVFSQSGQKLLHLALGAQIRAVTSGGDGTTSVNLSIYPRY